MSEVTITKRRGGYRPGAGRKRASIEDNVRAAIKKALAKDPAQLTRIWEKVFEKAEKGSDRHIQILFQYYYGKPVENVHVQSKQMIITRNVVSITKE